MSRIAGSMRTRMPKEPDVQEKYNRFYSLSRIEHEACAPCSLCQTLGVNTEMKKLSAVLILFIMGCAGIPENVKPVDNFKLEKYLGQWYEIARLDHSFERGLTRVTADYSLRDDGGVRVLNRGYSARENSWKEAEGKAYFVKGSDQGYLKVSLAPFTVLISFLSLTMSIINIHSYAVPTNLICGFWQENPESKKI